MSGIDPTDNAIPAKLASFNGADEKPVSASSAKRIIFLAGICLSRKALVTVVGERYLPETDPGDHTADEARLLWHGEQRVERPAAHQPEVAGIEGYVDLRRAREKR